MSKANYGVDAPRIVINLFLFSGLLAVGVSLSFCIQNPLWFWLIFVFLFPTFISLFVTGCWMLYGIKIAKPKIVLDMIQSLHLQGDEKILDLGCGQGLFLCHIAKYLAKGEAHGVDLWSNKDQSKNHPEKTLENAVHEGVKNKIILHTADVRALPFADQSFDVVVSSLCLHNIQKKHERKTALVEMLRVLKYGGRFVIADILYVQQYMQFFSSQGIKVSCSKPNYFYCPPIRVIEGKNLRKVAN